MANPPSLIMSYAGSNNTFSDTTQDFWSIVQAINWTNFAVDESGAQAAFLAGTASKLWCRVKTAATATSTMVLRINKANGTASVSITANTTGAFTDAVHSDTINGGDLVCYGITAGSTALVITIVAFTFVSTVSTNTKLGIFPNFGNLGGGSVKYLIPSGFSSAPSSEASAKLRLRKAMTVKNMSWMWVGGASASNTYTVISRKNGGNGNLTFVINSAAEQMFQDTTHSDSLAIGDDYNFQITVSSTAPNNGLTIMAADFVSSTGDCIFVCGDDGLPSISTSTTDYYGLSGSLDTAQTTEANTQVTVNSAFKFDQLTCNVTSNGITNTTTINLRVNSGNAGPTLSIGNGLTGIFNDNVNTYTAATTDAMNYQVITASTGTTLNLEYIEVYGNATAGAAAGGPMYQHFDNSTQVNRQNLNAFGGQLTIFG